MLELSEMSIVRNAEVSFESLHSPLYNDGMLELSEVSILIQGDEMNYI